MENQEITVVYKWTAKSGKAKELQKHIQRCRKNDAGNRTQCAKSRLLL